jgi:hypothetical protein
MLRHRRRQIVTQGRAADIERHAALAQKLADTAGRGIFLVQNDEDGQRHRTLLIGIPATRSKSYPVCRV